jgi:hypothetical protein
LSAHRSSCGTRKECECAGVGVEQSFEPTSDVANAVLGFETIEERTNPQRAVSPKVFINQAVAPSMTICLKSSSG